MKGTLAKLLILVLCLALMMLSFYGCTLNDWGLGDANNANTADESDKSKDANALEVVDGLFSLSDTARLVLANENARRAMVLALNKDQLVSQELGNGSKAVDYLVPPGLAISDEGRDYRDQNKNGWLHYDFDQANLYWSKAKLEVGFSEVEIPILTQSSDEAVSISNHIKGQLEGALPGLKVTVYGYDLTEKRLKSNQAIFGLEYFGWSPDFPDPLTYLDVFSENSPNNSGGYKNPNFNNVLNSIKLKPDQGLLEVRWKQLLEAEKQVLNDDVAVIPLYQSGTAYLTAAYVTGIENHGFGVEYTYKNADTLTSGDNLKILRLTASSNIDTLNPTKAYDTTSFEMMTNIMEGLIRLGQADVVEPGIAESWDISPNGKTYTFHLRNNAKWSNGTFVTADDFVFAWRLLANPENASTYSFILSTARIKNADKIIAGQMPVEDLGIEAIDNNTLRVHLEAPVPYFLKLMGFASFFPINRGFYEAQKDTPYGESMDTTLYNGPFALDQWDPGFGYAMTRNNYYWDADKVKLDKITFRILKDPSRGVQLYEEHSIDRCELLASQIEKYASYPNFSTKLNSTIFYLVFNMKTKLTQ